MTEWWREPQDEAGLVSPVTGLPYPPPPGVSPFPPPGTGLGGTPPVTPRPYAPPIGNEPMVVPPVGAQPRAPHNHPAWQPAPTPFGLPTPPAYADPGGSPVATYGVPWVIPRTEPLPWQMGPERIGLQPVVGAPPPRETVREQPPAPEPEVPRAPMGDMPGMGIGMALAQGQTLPLTAQRIRDTWERVGAPIEAYQLPWALRAGQQDRYQMGPERMGLPSDQRFPSVAEMMAPPAMLARRSLGEAGASPGDILGRAGARALGLVGAAVHDVQQVPVLARPARAVGAAVGTLANVVQAPAYVAEEAAALPIQWSGAGAVFPSLGPGKVLTPGQAAEVERRVAETGRWRWAVQQEVLAEAYADAPSLRDYAHQKWGRTPEVDQALARLGLMAWSSYPAQLGGLHRLVEGSLPDLLPFFTQQHLWLSSGAS